MEKKSKNLETTGTILVVMQVPFFSFLKVNWTQEDGVNNYSLKGGTVGFAVICVQFRT